MNLSFREKLWLWPGESAAWHFISVPKSLSKKVKKKFGGEARGWGSLRVEAKVGKTSWKTSIFPESKSGTYLLPVKASIRKKEKISEGDMIKVSLRLL